MQVRDFGQGSPHTHIRSLLGGVPRTWARGRRVWSPPSRARGGLRRQTVVPVMPHRRNALHYMLCKTTHGSSSGLGPAQPPLDWEPRWGRRAPGPPGGEGGVCKQAHDMIFPWRVSLAFTRDPRGLGVSGEPGGEGPASRTRGCDPPPPGETEMEQSVVPVWLHSQRAECGGRLL